MNEQTLIILKREAQLRTDFKFETAIDGCETIEELEAVLKIILGNVNPWGVSDHVSKTHNSIRVIRSHTYTRI